MEGRDDEIFRILNRQLDIIELQLQRSSFNARENTVVQRIAAIINYRDERKIVGDQYNVGQAGAVGPNAQAAHTAFVNQQAVRQIDLVALADELDLVRDHLRKNTTGTLDEDIALSELGHAQLAAKQGDHQKAMSHLRKAGKWAMEVATKIGTEMTIAAVKAASGL